MRRVGQRFRSPVRETLQGEIFRDRVGVYFDGSSSPILRAAWFATRFALAR
jgi:hypothetical protein